MQPAKLDEKIVIQIQKWEHDNLFKQGWNFEFVYDEAMAVGGNVKNDLEVVFIDLVYFELLAIHGQVLNV